MFPVPCHWWCCSGLRFPSFNLSPVRRQIRGNIRRMTCERTCRRVACIFRESQIMRERALVPCCGSVPPAPKPESWSGFHRHALSMGGEARKFKSCRETCDGVYCLSSYLRGRPGFDAGCKTGGACRGAVTSLNTLQNHSCQRRQLRTRCLIPSRVPSDWSRACASSLQASILTRSR